MRKRFSNSSKKIRVKKPWSTKKKVGVIAGIVLGVAALTAGGFLLWNMFFSEKPTEETKEPEIVRHFSPLTGVETTEENTQRPVTAVMIENSPEARPQSGLKQAGVVFEAVAEGGITRFIALYQEDQPELIGPVRSLRAYFVEWAAAFDPAIAHVGGSGDALSMVQSGNYGTDLDQFYNEAAYWRATDRYAPHNMYTNSTSLDSLNQAKGRVSSTFTPWPRQDGIPITATTDATEETDIEAETDERANTIVIPVSTGTFQVSYDFDPNTNTYTRYQGGEAHVDRELGQITPNVVIAMMVNMNLGGDGLHNEISTTGVGTAYIFQNGTVQKVTWSRSSVHDQIQFINSDGDEINLNRGQTWITAVPNNNTVTWQ